ncbi:MAG TPA: hypothetical protein VJM31_10420 [Vicinamibacterales bacterium]|nr:hypothetical protein [Vicinamibacterales bacterium]
MAQILRDDRATRRKNDSWSYLRSADYSGFSEANWKGGNWKTGFILSGIAHPKFLQPKSRSVMLSRVVTTANSNQPERLHLGIRHKGPDQPPSLGRRCISNHPPITRR